jgi:alanine racemase
MVHRPLRLRLDGDALVSNWRWLRERGGSAACGAAVKADGYGLGAREVVKRLAAAGCRDFFVSTWAEAEALDEVIGNASLCVLHGVLADDMQSALASRARPVLNSMEQVARWRGTGRPCDVMIDTGIARLGLTPEEAGAGVFDGLTVDTVHSHLACGDEDRASNEEQRRLFAGITEALTTGRRSLANSAGICLGRDYAFDLTRPGLALYGGTPRPEADGRLHQVAKIEAQVLQRRRVGKGRGVGYNATWTAPQDCELAILNLGYADGYLRGFSSRGTARFEEVGLPVVGRVSMDLIALRVDAARDLREGDWVEIDFDPPQAAAQSGLSQYELLTTLGSRFERIWT